MEVFDSLSLYTGNPRNNTLAWLVLQAKLTVLNRYPLHYVLTAVNTTSGCPSFVLQFNRLSGNINEAGRPLKQTSETSERGNVKCLGLRLYRRISSYFHRNEMRMGKEKEMITRQTSFRETIVAVEKQ